MKTQVFYGEYSLAHWVELFQSGNIELPRYQRSFKWGREKVQYLIIDFNEGHFIPPVTIARINSKNIILDGQQRLTSLLLAFNSKFPNFRNSNEWKFIINTDLASEEFDNYNFFDKIFPSDKTETKMEYQKKKDDFFKNNFLGFSFVICENNDDASEQNVPSGQNSFFAKTFYAMNTKSTLLTAEEKIDAYIDIAPELASIIKPEFEKIFQLTREKYKNTLIRLLGYVLQYKEKKSINNAEDDKYSTENRENIIESILSNREREIIDGNGKVSFNYNKPFKEAVNREEFLKQENFNVLIRKIRDELRLTEANNTENSEEANNTENSEDVYTFKQIAHFDLLFFGFLYQYLFEDMGTIMTDNDNKIKQLIEEYRNQLSYLSSTDSPNDGRYLLERMEKSIEMYKKVFLVGENNDNS